LTNKRFSSGAKSVAIEIIVFLVGWLMGCFFTELLRRWN